MESKEKDAQLANQAKEIEGKNSQVVLQEEIILKHTKEVNTKEKEISKLEAQLAGKEAEAQVQQQENSKLKTQLAEKNKELKDKDTVISYLDAQSVKKEAEMQEQLDKKVKYIINSDEDAGRIHQERKERNREEVLGPVALSDLFYENPSPEKRPTENSQSWTEWGIGNAKAAARLVVGTAMLAATAAPVLVGTLFEESSASPAGDRFDSINGTYSRY